ncbi:hypothetical protein WDZ92_10285 [Nostoc sp. NIES-2111]
MPVKPGKCTPLLPLAAEGLDAVVGVAIVVASMNGYGEDTRERRT